MQSLTFELTITEGNHEYWEELEQRGNMADVLKRDIETALKDWGFQEDYEFNLRLIGAEFGRIPTPPPPPEPNITDIGHGGWLPGWLLRFFKRLHRSQET